MARWEVEMHDLARDLSGQLETRMAWLGHLVREADRAAARLESALAAVETMPAEPPSAAQVSAKRAGPLFCRGFSDRPFGYGPSSSPCRLAGDRQPGRFAEYDAPPSPASSTAAAGNREQRSSHEEIYSLSDYGYPSLEIARRVGRPVGEVELILGLRAQRE